jgi:cardiolipin synthase (CMP-forming)
MAIATSGRPGGVPGAVARLACYALSVLGNNAANLLTLARLLCVPPLVLLVRAGEYHQATALFLVAALTDLADGYVAKRFNGATPLGAVLDPVADKLLLASLFVVLALEGHLPAWIVLLVIGRDLLIVLGTLALRLLAGRFRVEPLLLGKLSTFFQIVLGAAVLAELSVLPGLTAWLGPLLAASALLVVGSAVAYVHAAARIWALARVAR